MIPYSATNTTSTVITSTTSATITDPVIVTIRHDVTGDEIWQTVDGRWHERRGGRPCPCSRCSPPEQIFWLKGERPSHDHDREILKLRSLFDTLDAQAALRGDDSPLRPRTPLESKRGLGGRPSVRNRVCGGSSRYRVVP